MAHLTRRQLFKGSLPKRPHGAAETQGNGHPAHADAPRSTMALNSIAGDFPPELLALEAERLGLDPDSPDRDALLLAVHDAMTEAYGPKESGG
ncbi:hypothetical protein GO013_04495 [Pseudodesulfovibrio sp. JC047]|uniref:hypothetical protein n=1 Tax=Pseudodesulfovibrio sp. JC047 TaxID=2683199 RepID=UPI0013D83FAC|nr:hypothetical protein [Pseudodesulfovibrio sp. JC047]NDV18678.1 hypothetical protein [Pseudodesulfovibrio sp. JC047]